MKGCCVDMVLCRTELEKHPRLAGVELALVVTTLPGETQIPLSRCVEILVPSGVVTVVGLLCPQSHTQWDWPESC